MLTFFRVLLHLLYFGFVAVVELLAWQFLVPVIGTGWTVAVVIGLFIILMMIYAAIFWKWRPSGDGIGDFFDGIGDFGDFS
jgi:hypothetical protein